MDKRARWLASGSMELRPGGRVDLHFRHADLSPHEEPIPESHAELCNGVHFTGTVTRCEPPLVLSHTWSERSAHPSEVTYELTPQGEQVLLVLTHRKLAGRQLIVSIASGWHTHLAILLDELEGRERLAFWAMHSRLEEHYGRSVGA